MREVKGLQNEKEKMCRALFEKELQRVLLERLGKEYRTEISCVRKNNGVMKEVMYVRKENSECVPCFYMDELYRSYCIGEHSEGLAEHLADIVLTECEEVRQQIPMYLTKEWIIKHLFLRLVSAKENEELLTDAVYVEFFDFAAVFYVLTEDCPEGVKSFQIPKNVWERLSLGSAEAYVAEAIENTQRLFPERLYLIEKTEEGCVLHEELPERSEVRKDSLYPQCLYVLTNHRRINGAAVLLYPELLKRLGERFGGDFYLIPSSVHEVLLLKENEWEDVGYLNRMVREVNERQVAPEEILANCVYRYFTEEERLKRTVSE